MSATPCGLLKGEVRRHAAVVLTVVLCDRACPLCGCRADEQITANKCRDFLVTNKIAAVRPRDGHNCRGQKPARMSSFFFVVFSTMSHHRAGLNHWASRQIDTALTVLQHAQRESSRC